MVIHVLSNFGFIISILINMLCDFGSYLYFIYNIYIFDLAGIWLSQMNEEKWRKNPEDFPTVSEFYFLS